MLLSVYQPTRQYQLNKRVTLRKVPPYTSLPATGTSSRIVCTT